MTTPILQDYGDFITRKSHAGALHGFAPLDMPDVLFDFQKALVEWALLKGRAAIFADCGMGKTPMLLVWADNVVRHTNGSVLVLTPLAVAGQIVREAEKFGIEVQRSRDGKHGKGIIITNYERLHLFDPQNFVGVVCDESSILKSFNGSRRYEITEFMKKMPYRLLDTATAAPNDYLELGTSSEALGNLGHMDMLNRFFKNDQNNSATGRRYGEVVKWRFKGHAELPFWRWVTSWARALRKPSDYGFDDGEFVLPDLTEDVHICESNSIAEGYLFSLPAIGLKEQREEQRRTIKERCEATANLVTGDNPAIVWCHLNDEGDLLERMIPDAIQISGKESDDAKEEKFLAFANGSARVCITKPKIGAWGLNFQHCAHIVYFPSHSFESYYQAVRRCWRFGQKKPVKVEVVTTEGGKAILENLRRKSVSADVMFANLVAEMNNAQQLVVTNDYTKTMRRPSWI
jgi:hypothetical protein